MQRSTEAGPGPHPAASPFDKRISEHLGITAFKVYQVELPPYEETVLHDHEEEQVEDTYAFLTDSDWLVVDDETVAVKPRNRIRARYPCSVIPWRWLALSSVNA